MAKIAFYAEHLSERGTGVALFDYAVHVGRLLGHESIVIYNSGHPANNDAVIDRFRNALEVIPCDGFAQADAMLPREGCDLIYAIKAGKPDCVVSRRVPTMVHAVFPTSTWHVHGASFAFVSEWLADWCSGGRVPFVPHIASIGQTGSDMRQTLNIPVEATVFGCYGGRDSFDIGFVRDKVIPRVLEEMPQAHFLFMNITPFIAHDRVQFLPPSADLEVKTAFINSCDAMLHARLRGETFGLAVAEFSLCGKPVLTYGKSREKAHLALLGQHAITYSGAEDLYRRITLFEPGMPSARETYFRTCSAPVVMEQFAARLIEPAARNAQSEAYRALGLRPWHAMRLPLAKLMTTEG